MGLISDIRDLVRIVRQSAEGSLPCSHVWNKIAEIGRKDFGENERVNVVTMCQLCGETETQEFGPPQQSPCHHSWEENDKLEVWFQPRYVQQGNTVLGDKILKTVIYVDRCTRCGARNERRVEIHK